MKKLIIGIDPGKGGGICFIEIDTELSGDRTPVMDFFKYPDDPLKLEILVEGYTSQYSSDETFCAIEQVWAFPGDAKKAAFSFGFNYGIWNSVLIRNELDYEEVRPRKWQTHFKTPKLGKKERKRWLKELAIDLALNKYKTDKRVTFNVSDAILIAEYGRHLCE